MKYESIRVNPTRGAGAHTNIYGSPLSNPLNEVPPPNEAAARLFCMGGGGGKPLSSSLARGSRAQLAMAGGGGSPPQSATQQQPASIQVCSVRESLYIRYERHKYDR